MNPEEPFRDQDLDQDQDLDLGLEQFLLDELNWFKIKSYSNIGKCWVRVHVKEPDLKLDQKLD